MPSPEKEEKSAWEAKRTRRNTTRRRKQLKTTFGAFVEFATTTTTSNDYRDCLSLLFLLLDATTGPRSSVVCCEYCDSKASSLSSSSSQPFQRKGKRILRRRTDCCSPSSVYFSSIPSIPRNNERNRRRFRRRVTSPFVLYSYQTVYCVSTIYTRRKLRFILYNWRGKKWRKMLLTTQKEAFRRDTNHRTRRRMESTSSSVARVRRPVVCARARVRCLKCCRTKEHVGCARGRTDAPTRKFLSKIQCSFEHHFHGRHA